MTTPHQYLESVLDNHKFDQEETDDTAAARSQDVRDKLNAEYGSKIQTIRYSGSIAKATAIASNHDVDLAVHFKKEAFETLKEMFETVETFLAKHYTVVKQKVSVGIPSLDIDVVPGRRVNPDDPQDYDVNIYRTDKDSWMQTNIVKQIDHIRASGVRDVIKLTKVWRDTWKLHFKSFGLELLVIRALNDFDGTGLNNKMRTVLEYIRDNVKTVSLIDPGNSNNDVANSIDEADKDFFKTTANKCLGYLKDSDDEKMTEEEAWRNVFKDVSGTENNQASGSGANRLVMATQDRRVQPDRTHA